MLGGIDEAGRGSICGSLFMVGVVADNAILEIIKPKDSKLLSQKQRESIYLNILQANKQGLLHFHIEKISASSIDEIGLSKALRYGLESILNTLGNHCSHFIFDGNTTFNATMPTGFSHTITLDSMIKGDRLLPVISCASILAKVSKDRESLELSKQYPQYHLAKNKGYGTKAHIEAIKKYGYCPHHRKSYHISSLKQMQFFV